MLTPTDERPADLHLHSTCSDGLLSPSAMMELAAEAGLGVVALTDHDTLDGLALARSRGEELGLTVVSGLELTCRHAGRTAHLLAYGFEPDHGELIDTLAEARTARQSRLQRIVTALNGAGVTLRLEDVLAQAKEASPGRPHVADALVATGQVRSRQEAFSRWLADGLVGDVSRPVPSLAEGIALVHRAGGLAILAHPWKDLPSRADDLARIGLDGIEAFHPSFEPRHVKILQRVAERLNWMVTGGSDCHGDAKGLAHLRAARVPAVLGRELCSRLAERRRRRPDAGVSA